MTASSSESSLDPKPEPFHFSLISITATSAHPIRNSRQELIVGKHTLWSSLNPSIYPDSTRGSFQPNVFAYQFNSPVPEVGILDVTVKPLDVQLVGAEVLLFGIVEGKRVLQSDYFFFKSMAEVTVQAHVIIPSRSEVPFSWNADIDWGMELKLPSNQGLDRFGPGITRLELYWIATTVHRAFKEFLPVNFLRRNF
ncbi:hypothetical protein M378DRAFT_13279 [Amanita muscaria Koide BX008]|uniref:Uncharacterized protein n=1 Tax=Amanita muscaria (strain Koide BX008) TaxID=946122 RepID=A0A0C2T5G3_AMAMK|nr:hypothetical protein M378DRAFT_13279 [Amanita muscaria Koide BX008]